MKNPEVFAGYESFEFTDGPYTRRVWRKGSGPAVIVMHEMPNLHPQVLRFADRVAAQGMTVYCPSLFGEDGRKPSKAYTMGQMLWSICVRREFNVWANGKSSPISTGCARSPAMPTRHAAGAGSARWACASPAASRSR